MTTGEYLVMEEEEFISETFGGLLKCNFEEARFENCTFGGTVFGCNFADAVFTGCDFSGGTFDSCNFSDATGIIAGEIAGKHNNFGEAI